MKRYPEYKASGIEFIGEIPAHWEARKLGQVSTIFKGGTPKRNVDKYFQGDLPWARPVDITALQGALYIDDTEIHISEEALGNSGARRLPPGTVLLTSRATIGEIAITTVPMATNQGFANFVCNEGLLNIYLAYYLQAIKDLLISLGSGTTFLEITKGTLVGVKTPLPPLSEQHQIANFLDRKTEQIDELTRIKERQIELLHEHRAALINQTVTKGLDPNVEMKPSGVEWIGEIPAHWEVTQIKRIAQFIGGYSEFGSESYTERGIPIFRIGDIAQSIKMEEVKRVPIEQVKRLKQNQLCYDDTLIVMIGRRAGESIYYAFDYPSILSAQVAGLRATQVGSKFLFYFIHSASFLNTVTPLFFGATRDNISKTALMNIKIPFPPDEEQDQIANFLDHKTGQIDELIAIEGRKVELLKEYRQSLISHVVTGKIDVRSEV